MTTRAEKAAATRRRILDEARVLLREGRFHDASMEALAAQAGVTRVTLYRTFGSKRDLLEAIAWDLLAGARLDLVDQAHAQPEVRDALRQVLRANCQMFASLAEAMPLALELARHDSDMQAIVDATYHGRRHRAMKTLANRIVNEGAAAPGWTARPIADALLVLSSLEPFQLLVEHRNYSTERAADFLYRLASGFLTD